MLMLLQHLPNSLTLYQTGAANTVSDRFIHAEAYMLLLQSIIQAIKITFSS
jgi:hypothetical protein